MKIADIQTIWTRIKDLHPHTPREKVPNLSRETAELWRKALIGYDLETVLDAVERQRARKPYWPDLSEIMAELPPPPPSRTHLIQSAHASTGSHREDAVLEKFRRCFQELERKRREAGLPASYGEAKAAGLTCDEATALWENAGLDYPDNLDYAGGGTE